MKKNIIVLLIAVLLTVGVGTQLFAKKEYAGDTPFISYRVNPKQQDLQLYLKNEKNENFGSIQNLKTWLFKNKRKLVFAMNGGMYKKDLSPQGLYIENQVVRSPIDSSSGAGNFYLKPNGVFFTTTDNLAGICNTVQFKNNGNIKWATQSGSLLVIDGKVPPKFTAGSSNLNIRNGVGILPNNTVVFAMSKKEISFYEFANYFKSLGCKNALYLDGFVSRTYLPAQNWIQLDGNFGVIIAVTTKAD
jgi:uncharacterized protein YigE (DUF2233 family)